MMLPVANIPAVIVAFIEQDLLPKGNQAQRWMTVFMGAAIARQATTFVEAHKETLSFIGILKGDEIDIEAVRDLALEAFEKSGPVEIGGVVFNKDDVPTMYDIAKKLSKE